MIKFPMSALAMSVCVSLATPATAQVAQSGYTLPLNLATEAATAAVEACQAKGWPVSAIVADASGAL